MAIDPHYEILSALYAYAPGVELTRDLESALATQVDAGGPLSPAQVKAACAGLGIPIPVYPTQLPRFADSNPDPSDGWALDARARYGVN